jgi:hypothetical protein
MDTVDAERTTEAARNRRPGSKTTADSSLAERLGQPTSRKTSPAQPAGTPVRLLPTDKRPVVREQAGKIDPAAAAILAGLPAWIEEFVPERTALSIP